MRIMQQTRDSLILFSPQNRWVVSPTLTRQRLRIVDSFDEYSSFSILNIADNPVAFRPHVRAVRVHTMMRYSAIHRGRSS